MVHKMKVIVDLMDKFIMLDQPAANVSSHSSDDQSGHQSEVVSEEKRPENHDDTL